METVGGNFIRDAWIGFVEQQPTNILKGKEF
jgi:hypothetical protein